MTDGAAPDPTNEAPIDGMRAPRVSICIPVYNGAAFIAESLASALAQSFADVEVLVVDDCSSDQGIAEVRRIARGDPRVRVVVNDANRGLVGNWNRCIELARGEWIKFAFQDDLLDPDCVARLVAAGDATGRPLVACHRRFIFAEDALAGLKTYLPTHRSKLGTIYAERHDLSADDYCAQRLRHLDWENIVGEPTVTLIRRSVFGEVGVFDADLAQMCDGEMWDRIATNHGLAFVDEELVAFRVHGASATRQNLKRYFRGRILDQVVWLHDLLHSPRYARLQAVAARTGATRPLRARLHRWGNLALDRIRWAEEGETPDTSYRAEFERLEPRHPRMRVGGLRHLVHRLRRRVLRVPDIE